MKKNCVVVCGYCGNTFLIEATFESEPLIRTGCCEKCWEKIRNNEHLRQKYVLKGNRVIELF